MRKQALLLYLAGAQMATAKSTGGFAPRQAAGGQWLKYSDPAVSTIRSAEVIAVEVTETFVSTSQVVMTLTNRPAYTSYPTQGASSIDLPITIASSEPPHPAPIDDPSAKVWLEEHNRGQAEYGANPLVWRRDLVDKAKANAMLCSGEHSNAGENIAAQSGQLSAEDAVRMWLEEHKLYNWNAPGFSYPTGHFTQAIWKSSRYIGCHIQKCAPGTVFAEIYGVSYQATCEYDPAGNVVNEGQFELNVGRKVS